MPKLLKKCSAAIMCQKCELTYIPDLKSYQWHKKNCEFMENMNKRIRTIRKNELKFEREYFKNLKIKKIDTQ